MKTVCCRKRQRNIWTVKLKREDEKRTTGKGSRKNKSYRTKCVDKNYHSPAKGCNGNRLRLPSPHREIPFEQRSRSLSESTEASDLPLCIPFAKELLLYTKKVSLNHFVVCLATKSVTAITLLRLKTLIF